MIETKQRVCLSRIYPLAKVCSRYIACDRRCQRDLLSRRSLRAPELEWERYTVKKKVSRGMGTWTEADAGFRKDTASAREDGFNGKAVTIIDVRRI